MSHVSDAFSFISDRELAIPPPDNVTRIEERERERREAWKMRLPVGQLPWPRNLFSMGKSDTKCRLVEGGWIAIRRGPTHR